MRARAVGRLRGEHELRRGLERDERLHYQPHPPGRRAAEDVGNLSARQVAQRDLSEFVAGVLRSTGLQASCLSLEITESVLLEESENLTDTLVALRGLGVRLVLDDFGTGYSSLGYSSPFSSTP